MSNLTDKQIGYIAGIIDGEGTICLHKCTWKHRKSVYYRPFIKIANSNLTMLKSIQSILGCGSIKMERLATGNWKAMYTLNFSANMIRTFLPDIIDTLIIKKEQAYLITEFMKLSKHRGANRTFKSINQDKYDVFYNRVKVLNTRGVVRKTGEFGETLTGNADGNPEPSKNSNVLGVCNEHGLVSKEMICSDLMGNHKTLAEMTKDSN